MSRRSALLAATLAACSRTVTAPADGSVDATARDVADVAVDRVAPPRDVPPRDVPPRDVPNPYTTGVGARCTVQYFGIRPFELNQGACPDGMLCLTERAGYHLGYCTVDCGGADCPAGSVCGVVGGVSLCHAGCGFDRPCRDRDGYECRPFSGETACMPVNLPTGLRDDGACFGVDGGAHPADALGRAGFPDDDFAVSAADPAVRLAAEGNVVVNPRSGAALAAFIATEAGHTVIGTARVSRAGAVTATASVEDPVTEYNSDPVLALDASGATHLVWIGHEYTAGRATGSHVRHARSDDEGARWSTVTSIDPAGRCDAGLCDKPWITAGPAPGGDGGASGDALYVSYATLGSSDDAVWVQRSDDGGETWSPPSAAARGRSLPGVVLGSANLTHMAVDDEGVVHLVYAGRTGVAGDVVTLIYYQRSTSGGARWSAPVAISPRDPGALYAQPWVATDGRRVHVAWATGSPTGATDIVLATSDDNGPWTRRRVNDDPEPCATHRAPTMTVDRARHLVHALWVENRFGDGAVAHAVCPGEPTLPCGPNGAVTTARFRFTNARDPSTWFGDYFGLAVDADGRPWAAWADTRTGRSAFYVARGAAP